MDIETGSPSEADGADAAKDALRRREIVNSLMRAEIDRYEDALAHLTALRQATQLQSLLLREISAKG